MEEKKKTEKKLVLYRHEAASLFVISAVNVVAREKAVIPRCPVVFWKTREINVHTSRFPSPSLLSVLSFCKIVDTSVCCV